MDSYAKDQGDNTGNYFGKSIICGFVLRKDAKLVKGEL